MLARFPGDASICGEIAGQAPEILQKAPIHKIVVTNTINFNPHGLEDKLETISVAKIFATSIRHITEGKSLSSLFEVEK